MQQGLDVGLVWQAFSFGLLARQRQVRRGDALRHRKRSSFLGCLDPIPQFLLCRYLGFPAFHGLKHLLAMLFTVFVPPFRFFGLCYKCGHDSSASPPDLLADWLLFHLGASHLAREAEASEPENAAPETGIAKPAVSPSHIARTSSDHNQV